MSRFDYFCLGYVVLLLFIGFRDEPEGHLPKRATSQLETAIGKKVGNLHSKVSADTTQRRLDQIGRGSSVDGLAQHNIPSSTKKPILLK